MPIYTYECKLCNRKVDSLEVMDKPFIEVECFCLAGMTTMYTRVLYTDSNIGIVNGGTPRFNDKRRKS